MEPDMVSEEELLEPPAVNVKLVLLLLTVANMGIGSKRTDTLASVLADLLEVLGGSVLVVAAVLGEEASHLLGGVGADLLDVGGLRALAV